MLGGKKGKTSNMGNRLTIKKKGPRGIVGKNMNVCPSRREKIPSLLVRDGKGPRLGGPFIFSEKNG